jgi:hypothetical protein
MESKTGSGEEKGGNAHGIKTEETIRERIYGKVRETEEGE